MKKRFQKDGIVKEANFENFNVYVPDKSSIPDFVLKKVLSQNLPHSKI